MFYTSNKDYIIEISSSFIEAGGGANFRGFSNEHNFCFFNSSNKNTNNNYIYYIYIKNNLNTLIRKLSCSKIDLLIILDNLNELYSGNINEISIHFDSNNSNMIENILDIKLEVNINSFIIDLDNIIFTLYDYINNEKIKIIQFNMTGKVDELIDEIYNVIEKENCSKLLQEEHFSEKKGDGGRE